MEFKQTLIVITAVCLFALVECSFKVEYTGESIFKIGTDATFVCEVTPKPESAEGVTVTWSKANEDGSTDKIVRATYMDSPAYYNQAQLSDRFFMSNSELNSTGMVRATLSNVTIDDAGMYICDVDDEAIHIQDSVRFSFSVYQLPVVEIEILQPVINLRSDPVEYDAETSNTTENAEPVDETAPEDPILEIARCSVYNSYPSPSMIIFEASTGDSWSYTEYDETIENNDGTYDVSITLNLESSSSLDGVSITCKALVTENQQRSSESSSSEPIVVYYPTSFVDIIIRPSRIVNKGDYVTIRCDSDGNPAPQKFVYFPDGQPTKLSGVYEFPAILNSIGYYYCTAEDPNSGVFQSNSAYLDVYSLSSVKITGPTILVDGDSTLKCSSEGRGPVTYAWRKADSNEVLSKSSLLTLDHSNVETSGTYICTVTRAGETLSAQYTATVQKSCNPTMDVLISGSPKEEGEAFVQVTCVASGNPPCEMTMTGYKETQATTSDNKAVLTVEAFPLQMQAYMVNCTASNALGTQSVSKDLNHEDLCCVQPSTGGMSGGVVVLIIIIVAFIVIGAPLACFLLKPKGSSSSKAKKNDADDVEKDRFVNDKPDKN